MKPKTAESQAIPTVVVVGGGASGALIAIRLAGSEFAKRGGLRVRIVEKAPVPGRGLAYGTDSPFHLLNVRQERMSAFPEEPGHFERWIARNYSSEKERPFQPRSRYGEYLGDLLSEARAGVPDGAFEIVRGEADSFKRVADGRISVSLADGTSMGCDRLVLATGYRSPTVPKGLHPVRESARFVGDPWASARAGKIGAQERLLVLGSGLTTVDFVLSRIHAGHAAPIDVVSRHGLLPIRHSDRPAKAASEFPFPDESPRGILRAIRTATRNAGSDWAGVVDHFRDETQRIWAGWSEGTRRRFLRHARAYWEIHRHRVAPEAYGEWETALRGGSVRVQAGRMVDVAEGKDGIRVRIAKRGGPTAESRYDRIVNCTGAVPDLALLENHEFIRDPLGLGAITDVAGRPLRTDGSPDPKIFVFGPALRSRFWEMTAIPDLRLQAKTAVDAILEDLAR